MPTYRLTTRAVIMQPACANDFEATVERDEKVCDAWVDVQPVSGNERVVAQQLYASANYAIVMRKQREALSPTMYVVASGDRYPITSVLEVDGGYLKLMCTKAA